MEKEEVKVGERTYKDEGIIRQVASIGQLFANDTEAEELVLDAGGNYSCLQMLYRFTYSRFFFEVIISQLHEHRKRMHSNVPGSVYPASRASRTEAHHYCCKSKQTEQQREAVRKVPLLRLHTSATRRK